MSKTAHHLWSAESDGGKVIVKRSAPERDDWTEEELEYARNVNASAWGLFGASVIDDEMFSSPFSKGFVAHLNKAASTLVKEGNKLPKVATWREIKKLASEELVNEIREAVAKGIKARRASLFYDVPLVIAYDLEDSYQDVDKAELKKVINALKNDGFDSAYREYGKIAGELNDLFLEYKEGGYKIALDDSAKQYWLDYMGPFGEDLVREIKKRVRADLASAYLRKQGVDEAAKKYWENYYGAYGSSLVKGDSSKKRI